MKWASGWEMNRPIETSGGQALLLDVGANFIRGAHYPQDPRWLDLCDEFGVVPAPAPLAVAA